MTKIRACVKYDKHLETIDKTFDRNEILGVKLATNIFPYYAKGRKCGGCLKEEIDIFNVFC